ncbi:hypothetical protein Phi39:1_gp38 [Cellulophaga phage phi39:1]|uniref:hypothetical protein n=1 Tax=Cellulophaga phage phi39:1 TaxID=1327993 RepID=UPI000351F77B|nr:hypothetical protein Phi39:1_gp38 [Cellulophaga phage phi39:1]AGO49153.1 hypothetical protein Phi39:1_gp38 [Cellulophaga phage phi39:1]
MEKVNLSLEGNNLISEEGLVIRTGEAAPVFKVRKGIAVEGCITVPLSHLVKRTLTINRDYAEGYGVEIETGVDLISESYLEVDREKMKIVYREAVGKSYESTYAGKLEFSEAFLMWGINDSSITYSPLNLSEKIKMNRGYFEDKTAAMKLVGVLRNFEAKISKEVEESSANNGDRRSLRAQKVVSNLPEAFKIKSSIFKGQNSVLIELEIVVDPYSLECRLISPEVNDYIINERDEIIAAQIALISENSPELRIFDIS